MKRKFKSQWSGPVRIRANLAKQKPNNSYSPKTHYESLKFDCRDCGTECVWTAAQQKHYYEELKGEIYATAIRCPQCRIRVWREKMEQRRQMAASSKPVRKPVQKARSRTK